jgi:hypothetical protein
MGDVMRGNSCLIAVLAALAMSGTTLCAQENSQSTPPEASPPQAPLAAQSMQPPEFGDSRFAFYRIDNGFLRLDLRTGALASCSQHGSAWVCVPALEERTALEGEIARLQRDNAVLKNALLEHGVPLPNGMKPDISVVTIAPAPAEAIPRPPQSVPPAASPKSTEPDRASRDDAELERVMVVMEKFWRRLVEMMVNIQRDIQKKG